MRGRAVWSLVGLISRRSAVQIRPPLPKNYKGKGIKGIMKIVMNPKLIKPDYNQGHTVTYCLYTEGSDDITLYDRPPNAITNRNTACFAGLLRELGQYKDVNRIMYSVQKNAGDGMKKSKVEKGKVDPLNLDSREMAYWIRICKDNKALPDYVDEQWTEGKKFVLKIDNTVTPSLMYVYLTCLRSLQEDPGFIRAMIYAITGYFIDFAAAWCLGSRLAISNSGHNIIPIGRIYGRRDAFDINNAAIPIGYAIAIKRFLNNPYKYDTRCLRYDPSKEKGPDKSRTWASYQIHSTLGTACRINKEIKAEHLFDQEINDAINSETDEEAQKYLKSYT